MTGESDNQLKQRIAELEQELADLQASSVTEFSGDQDGHTLKESDEKFESLFDGINQPVLVHPFVEEGFAKFIEVNKEASEVFGYTRAEFLKLSPADISAPMDAKDKGSRKGRKRLTESGQRIFEATHIRKDGTSFPVEISSNIFTWLGRKVILSIVRDITEQRIAEQSLRESEERFREYIESSPNGVFIVDSTGRCIEVNKAACDTTNLTEEELLSKNMLDLIEEDDQEMVLQQFEEVKRIGRATGDISFPREDGSWSYWKVNAVKLSEDRYLGFVSDITGIKRAEKESRDKEKVISALLKAIPTPVFFKDKDGLYQGCNQAYTDFMGITADELKGKMVHHLWPDMFSEGFHYDDIELMKNPGHMVYEYQLKDKNGIAKTIVTSKDVLRNESGEVTGIVGAFIDVTDLKIAREELQEEKKKLEGIFKASPIGIALSVKFLFQGVNDKICEMTGYSRNELLGQEGAMLFCSREEYEQGREKIDRQIKNHGTGCYETRWRKKNGEVIHVVLSASSLNPEDLREGVIITALDITESRNSLEALHESEKQLRLLVNNSIDVIWQLDLEMRFTYSSPSIYALTGYSQEEWIGSKLSSFTSPGEYSKIRQRADNAFKDFENFTFLIFEAELLKKDGSPVPVEITARLVFNQDGRPVGIQGSTRDITQRKQTEEALQDSDAYLTYLFRNVPAGIIVVDTETRLIIDANSFACNLIGLSKDAILNRTCREFICVDSEDCPILDLGDNLNNSERMLRNSEGNLIPVLKTVMSARLKNRDYLIEIFTDISERKQAEEQRMKLEQQLQQSQKMESIGTMAGGIAHDFNNLLTVINGYSEMVLHGLSEESPLFEKLDEILKAGKSAEHLTSQLLAFSRKQLYKPESVEVNSVIRNMDKMIRRLIGEDITITTVLQDGISRVNADRSQLEQIFVNLVVNARDAVYSVKREGFRKNITIETGELVLDEDFVKNNHGSSLGRHVFIAVSDNGIGIRSEDMQKIFEPFFTTKESYKGTGLGLSTVYGIVKQNGGNVQVSSVPELGTAFHIYWPVLPDNLPVSTDTDFSSETAAGKETILIVEDNQAVCGFAYEALTNLGYQVATAENGRKALNMLESEQFTCELILTDLIMPEINGTEFARQALELLPEVEVIYMSGYTNGQIVHEGMLDKDVNFIQKPYSIKALANIVRRVLDSR